VLLAEAPTVHRLAPLGAGGAPLAVVRSGLLQAARSTGDWTLVACIVAPGFEFEDFELPLRGELERAYPDDTDLIRRYTRHDGS
jgi:predicted cupin superfamily sugar epimerase